jgi:peroxiredoxin
VQNRPATVIIFIAHDCPVCNGYAPEINRLTTDYRARGIGFDLVYIDTDLTVAEARKHARSHGFTATTLRDPHHLLVKALQAKVTPEAFVIGAATRIYYRGRIDDRVQDYGKMRHAADVYDLRNALDAILARKPVASPRTKPIGCFITDQS